MNFPFEPRFGLIMVSVTLHGPAARGRIRLALDQRRDIHADWAFSPDLDRL